MLTLDALTVRRGRDGPVLVGPVGFTLAAGGRLGVVGESGSGKSLTALALTGLLPAGLLAAGSAELGGVPLLNQSPQHLRQIRGRRIGMVFQDPLSALNPVMRIGAQIAEPLRHHLRLTREAARARAQALLEAVRMPQAAARLDAYPHQLSGGQRQRVGLAMAIAAEPDLLIADEPTSALDVTVQAEILDLLDGLLTARSMALLLISHDFAVTARLCRHVLVLYAGAMLEYGRAVSLLNRPAHPYTAALLAARPDGVRQSETRLPAIPGQVPPPAARPAGCVFRDRCPRAGLPCTTPPPWRELAADHWIACHFPVAT